VRVIPRFGRWLALAVWATSVVLPPIALPRIVAAGPAALAPDICTTGGVRTPPAGHHQPDAGQGCPCCTSWGTAALPSLARVRIPGPTPHAGHAVPVAAPRAAATVPLPPSRGPPA
jgi:hypothetical protein